jgi:hypothetical protein
VVVKDAFAKLLLRQLGQLHQGLVTLPRRGVEQLLAPLLRHDLLGGLAVVVVRFLVGIFVAIVTLQPRFDFRLELGECRVQLVAVFGVNLAAQCLVARGKAQAFDGAAFELTFEA